MNGFVRLMLELVIANGLPRAEAHENRKVLTLPVFFRPAKLWDLPILNEGRLVAALEFKSQVGPSFGNNFNNRTEEAIGTGADFWTAFREKALGDTPRPFVGWLVLSKTLMELSARQFKVSVQLNLPQSSIHKRS